MTNASRALVGKPHAGVRLRPFPFPYRAMLAISSDIDMTRADRFREIHRFLNTREQTTMGPGLGLDVGDSFWFYARGGPAAEFSIFGSLDWSRRATYADELLHYLRVGWIDSMHSYGNFSGADPAQQCTRAHAEAALGVLASEDVAVRVWINHGDAANVQNIGDRDYMQGDLPGSDCYHWDLLRAAGVEYLWNSAGDWAFAESSKLTAASLRDGSNAWQFTRFWRTEISEAEAHGLLPAVAQQMSGRRSYAPLWFPQHLHVQLSEARLDELVRSGGYAVVGQHLGATPPLLGLGKPALLALRRLAGYQERGDILVARTQRLLDFNRAHDHVRFHAKDEHHRVVIDIKGIEDPVRGWLEPSVERLRGITFYVPDDGAVELRLGGNRLPEELVQLNPHDGIGRSAGIPWFPADRTDHSREFAAAEASAANGRPDAGAVARAAIDFLDTQADDPPSGVTPQAYAYALKYTRDRYRIYEASVDRMRSLGLNQGGRGLDIGSGAGHWCLAFVTDGGRAEGIDKSKEFVELATRVANHTGNERRAHFQVGRAEELPFADGWFATAWSHSVFHFVDIELAMREVARVLQRGGVFYCGWSGFGHRIVAARNELQRAESTATIRQVGVLLGERLARAGLTKSGWSSVRAPTLDEMVTAAAAAGMQFLDQPGVQDEATVVLGHPMTADMMVRNAPANVLREELVALPAGPALYRRLGALLAAWCARTVIEALSARDDRMEDARVRRFWLEALLKGDRAKDSQVKELAKAETDPTTLGLVRHALRDHEGALAHYALAADDPRSDLLAGAALLRLGRDAEAEAAFTRGASAGPWAEVDCRIGLLEVARRSEDLSRLREEFERLEAALATT